jgi:hypothetical protein
VIFIAQKSTENGESQSGVPPLDAEELYRRYLRIRSEKEMSRNETDYPISELKKAKSKSG